MRVKREQIAFFIIVFFFVTIISLFIKNGQLEEANSVLSQSYEENIREKQDELDKKDIKIEDLNKKVISLNQELSNMTEENKKVTEVINSLQSFDDEYIDLSGNRIAKDSIYYLSKSVPFVELKEIQVKEVNQYILPYEESMAMSTLNNKDLVEVIAYVNNSKNEPWALVIDTFARGIGAPSMGYVKLECLTDITEKPIIISDHDLQDISIGDSIEHIISLLGRNYELVQDDYFTAIVYDDLYIFLDRYGYYANSITVDMTNKNEFEFDGKVYNATELNVLSTDLEVLFERYYDNENTVKETGGDINFIEFSLSENYTLLIHYDDKKQITEVSIGSSGWCY